MRLTELNPRWMGAGGENVWNADGTPAQRREGIGVMFDCPCSICSSKRVGDDDADFHLRHYVPFDAPLDGGQPPDERQTWHRVGETFETLQLTPSILSDPAKSGCGWHGYVGLEIPGEVTTL